MSTYSSADVAFLLANGFSLAGFETDFSEETEAELQNDTRLTNRWEKNSFVDLKRGRFSQNGFFDDAAAASHDALLANNGASVVLCFGVAGNVIGRRVVCFAGALQTKYKRGAAAKQLHIANASYEGNGDVDNGVLLHALSAETVAGNTEGAGSVDNGASSAGGGAGWIQVVDAPGTPFTLGGFDNLIAKVRHSTDDTVYVDLLTFTAATGRTAQRLTTAVTVNRHLATSHAWTGAGAAQNATFAVGFARAA